MRTPEGIVLIDADKDREVAFEVGENKIVMSDFAKKFNKYQAHVVTQDGYVAATDGKCNLEIGDHVYGHHFMCEPEKEIVVDEKKYYSNTYESLYCRVKYGEIEMLGEWNFIKPIYEPIENVRTKSGIYISNVHSAINNFGIVMHPSDYLKEHGVHKGDIVYFPDDREYDITIGEDTFYRIKDTDIYASADGMRYEKEQEVLVA